jgi:hypothetical protein
MLSGSKRYSPGAVNGLVPERSPQSRMKFVDSFVRFCAQGTSPVLTQRSGIQTVLAAASAAGVSCGTTSGAVPRVTSASTANQRRHLGRGFIGHPYVSRQVTGRPP